MKRLLPVFFVLCAFVVEVKAANPSFQNFNPKQFQTTGNNVNITNGALTTNMQTTAQNYPTTDLAASAISGRATNQSSRNGYGFSANLGGLPNFHRKMNQPGHKPRILWYGDSTGADTVGAFWNFFGSNTVGGVDRIIAGTGSEDLNSYFDIAPNSAGVGQLGSGSPGYDSSFYASQFSLTNGSKQTFGIRNSVAALADNVAMYYIAGASYATMTVEVSTTAASNTWSVVMTIDTSLGTAGFRMTNKPVTLNNYYVRVSCTTAAGQGRVLYWWPDLSYEASTAFKLYDMHEGGAVLNDWLNQGVASISSELTNIRPDIIVWQQTKQVSSLNNWTNVATNFHTFASNSDVIIVQSQPSNDPTIEADPANGGQFQLPVSRDVAISNNWVFVDLRSYLDWTNVVNPAGFTLGGSLGVHLNSTGQIYSGSIALRESGIQDILLQASLLSPNTRPSFSLPTVFNPQQLTNMQYLYDVPATNLTSGTSLSFISDRSGAVSWIANGRDMIGGAGAFPTFTTASNLNNRGYAHFSGGQVMEMDQPVVLIEPLTMFAVIRAVAPDGGYFVDGTNDVAGQRLVINDSFVFNAGTEVDYTLGANVWYVMEVDFGTNVTTVRTNGALMTNSTAAASGILSGLTFGARVSTHIGHLTGDIAYFSVYNFFLSKAQRAQVTDAINKEFNIFATNVYSSYAVGPRYTNTASTATVVFDANRPGVNIPEVTLPTAGTYLIWANANYQYVGATYAANQTATLSLQKTNATASTVGNSTRIIELGIVTTITSDVGMVSIPPVLFYANGGETIQMQSALSATPSAGSVVIDSAEIVAQKLY